MHLVFTYKPVNLLLILDGPKVSFEAMKQKGSLQPNLYISSYKLVLRFMALSIYVFVFLCGCAYNFGNERVIPSGAKSVTVPVFKNLTHETGIEAVFTDSMIREIERTGSARVVPSSKSEVTLLGEIQNIQYVSAGTQTQNLPQGTSLNLAYRVLVNLKLTLKKNDGGDVLWTSSFVGERAYNAPRVYNQKLNSANALYNQSSRTDTLTQIAKDLSLEAFNQMTENF